MAQLSANDSRVLSALFDPEASPSGEIKVDSSSTALPNISSSECTTLQREHTAILAPLSSSSADTTQTKETLTALSAFISAHPAYGPAYVDRAQLTRLNLPTSDLFTTTSETASRSLLSDLQQAVALTTPLSPADPISALQSRTLAAAHTHRGLLLLRIADLVSKEMPAPGAPAEVTRMTSDEIEGLASQDFTLGGRYGNAIAKGLAVKTNPYAKMCGAIVKEAMREEIGAAEARGEFVGSLSGFQR